MSRLTPSKLLAFLEDFVRNHPSAAAVGVAVAPDEASHTRAQLHGQHLHVAGKPVLVSFCFSVLAVREALQRPDQQQPDTLLVVLTCADEAALGDDVRARLHGRHLKTIRDWALARLALGIRTQDPQLANYPWMPADCMCACCRG